MKNLFVFDLDSTVTKCELLPMIAKCVGLEDNIACLTECAMMGKTPFAENFAKRVELLRCVPVSMAREIAESMPVYTEIAAFLRDYSERCLIFTGNLDVWIEPLIERLGMRGRCRSSVARVEANRLIGVGKILDKTAQAKRLPHPFVAIGDGDNDMGLLSEADIGIAFSGARAISENVKNAANRVFDDEAALAHYLRSLA